MEKSKIEVMIRFNDGNIMYFNENGIKVVNYSIKHKEDKFNQEGAMEEKHNHCSFEMLSLIVKADFTDKETMKNLPFNIFKDFEKEKNICIIITESIRSNIVLRERIINKAEIVCIKEKFDIAGMSNDNEIIFKANKE